MVLEIHRIVRNLHAEEYQIVIIGDHNHDEVRGIAGRAPAPAWWPRRPILRVGIRRYPKLGVVVQSTQSLGNVQQILPELVRFSREIRFINTICKPTTDHQADLPDAAPQRHHDHRRVVHQREHPPAHGAEPEHQPADLPVQTAADVRAEWFEGVATVGIAGASTPDVLIREVVDAIRRIDPGAEVDGLGDE